jgi:hypothetical protein
VTGLKTVRVVNWPSEVRWGKKSTYWLTGEPFPAGWAAHVPSHLFLSKSSSIHSIGVDIYCSKRSWDSSWMRSVERRNGLLPAIPPFTSPRRVIRQTAIVCSDFPQTFLWKKVVLKKDQCPRSEYYPRHSLDLACDTSFIASTSFWYCASSHSFAFSSKIVGRMMLFRHQLYHSVIWLRSFGRSTKHFGGESSTSITSTEINRPVNDYWHGIISLQKKPIENGLLIPELVVWFLAWYSFPEKGTVSYFSQDSYILMLWGTCQSVYFVLIHWHLVSWVLHPGK